MQPVLIETSFVERTRHVVGYTGGWRMKVACDHCDQTARGSRDDLIDLGWCRVTLFAPMRRMFTGCPEHTRDALRDAVAAIDAEQERVGRRRPLAGVLE